MGNHLQARIMFYFKQFLFLFIPVAVIDNFMVPRNGPITTLLLVVDHFVRIWHHSIDHSGHKDKQNKIQVNCISKAFKI